MPYGTKWQQHPLQQIVGQEEQGTAAKILLAERLFVTHMHSVGYCVLTAHQDGFNSPGPLLHSHILTGERLILLCQSGDKHTDG